MNWIMKNEWFVSDTYHRGILICQLYFLIIEFVFLVRLYSDAMDVNISVSLCLRISANERQYPEGEQKLLLSANSRTTSYKISWTLW